MLKITRKDLVSGHKGSVFTIYQEDDSHILSGGGEGWIVRWNMNSPDPGKLLAKVEANVFSLFAHDHILIAGDMHGGIHSIDLNTNETIDLQHHRNGIFEIFHHKGFIYALGGDGYISRRPLDQFREVESIQISPLSLRSCTQLDDQRLAIGSSDGNIYLFDLEHMKVNAVFENAHDLSVFSLAWDGARGRLWSGGRDAQIKVWDLDGQQIQSIPAHMFTVNSLQLDHSKNLLFSGSRDKSIRIWDAETFELHKVIDGIRDGGHLNSVNCLLWCPDSQLLISGSDDNRIGFWSVIKTNDILR